jgi:hypothetical protein
VAQSGKGEALAVLPPDANSLRERPKPPRMKLAELDDDVLFLVISQLHPIDIISLRLVCHHSFS